MKIGSGGRPSMATALCIVSATLVIVLGLVACGPLGAGPAATPTQEVTFPPLDPVGGLDGGAQPPGAWLIVGDQVYPATYGSFCYDGTCADMVAPSMMPNLATATVPAGATPAIRIGATSPVGLDASVQPWGAEGGAGPAASRQLAATGERVDDATVYTLEPIGNGADQILIAFVRFAEGGDASYLWRINPAG